MSDDAAGSTGTTGKKAARQHWYEPTGFFLLRAPALPFEVFTSLGECDSREQAMSRLREVGRDPRTRRALEVAGSDLVDALRRVEEVPALAPKRVRRAYAGLWRYVTRMASRATPFGSFAGVALGEFHASSVLALGERALGVERIRADMGWLMAWIKQLEEDPAALHWVRLTANDMVYDAGDRLVLPLLDVHGKGDRRAASVRATAPVRLIMRTAAGVSYEQLVDTVYASFPQAGRHRAEELVKQMYEIHLITSDLRPPLGDPRPDRWLLRRLEELPGSGSAEHAAALRQVVELARRAEGRDLGALHSVQRRMAPEYRRQTYQLDSALDVQGAQLSGRVAADVAEAADCLFRLAAAGGTDPLGSYRAAFRNHYSENTLVPVRELLSPERGLDAPDGYRHPPRSYPLQKLEDASDDTDSGRDQALCALPMRALRTGTLEIELTEELLDRLAPNGDPAVRELAPVTALDVFVQIQAESLDAIDEGRYRAVVTGTAPGSGTCGRFSDLLGPDAPHLLTSHAARQEHQLPHAAVAELSYLPLAGVGGNVAISPRLHTYEIPVNTTPSVPADRVLPLDDILVGATLKRLYLWSRRLNREILVTQNNRLNYVNAPNICRFLLEVSRQRQVSPQGFPWGDMESAPFLPRVVRGRAVLSSARWRLSDALLADEASHPNAEDFASAVEAWRKAWGVPRLVHLFDGPDPLTLDLEQPLCLDELRTALRRQPDGVILRETPALPGRLWLRDNQGRAYTSEVVVPLIRRHTLHPGSPRAFPRAAVAEVGSVPRTRHLPGGTWSSLNLYSLPDQHNRIIAGALRDVITACHDEGLIDRWFFIRYADPRPHLRIRLRARTPDTAGRTLSALLTWAQQLTRSGTADDFSVTRYDPEVERYGGATVFDHVERLFEASSSLTTKLIADALSGDAAIDPDCLTVAVLDTLYTQWGLSLDQRLAVAPVPSDPREAAEARAAFHTHRDYLCELLDLHPHHADQRALTDRRRLSLLLLAQQPAVATASAAVRAAVAEDQLWGTEHSILTSLAHMQVNRLRPIDHSAERRCYRMWRQTLRAIQGRQHAVHTIAGHPIPSKTRRQP
ncbi:lantibiotic dehydratase [Streptomyces sioyaensis]|uniref:lantibiotic dehydratase n=1 Tax=Streptomyces sioyaensis TaxID=67364 RepID=UPI0037D15E48